MRRIVLLSVVLLAGLAEVRASQTRENPPPPQPPTFRAGTNLVQVDAIITDDNRPPITASAAEVTEIRLALGNLGPGDYVIELTARTIDEAAQQWVAFRVVR